MTHVAGKASATIHTALADELRASILDRKFQPGEMIGSEYELARQHDISRMTVRRASELLVAEGILERRPGKGLFVRANATTQLVQVVTGNLRWEPCFQVSRGAQVAAKGMGIAVQLYDAHGDAELDLEFLRNLPSTQARGAIIVALHNSAFNEAVFGLKRDGFPFVLVDQKLHDIDVPSVMADNEQGGHLAGSTLLEKGHRRIAFIGNLSAVTVRDRLEGLRNAVGDAGLPFDRNLVADISVDQDPLGDWSTRVEDAARAIMSKPNPPTAIFCSCDAFARSAYRAMNALNLNIPRDVSIIGFDNDPLAEWLHPGLTTIRQPFEEMGRAAVDLLMQRMADPNAKVEHRVLPVELVSRGSVAPALKCVSV